MRVTLIAQANTQHGETHSANGAGHKTSSLYSRWVTMRERCYRPASVSYSNYGGKGIKVCDAWHDFKNFAAWAYTHGYESCLQIDRIDSSQDYCPENCRWVTSTTNQRNKASVVLNVDMVRLIKQDYADGLRPKALSEKYGVARSTIGSVVYGCTWRDVIV
jgi:hypothetical protein